MSLNRVIVSGRISDYGVRISWTESGKPQVTFTLVCEEPGREGSTFNTFVPVLIVGAQCEALADTLEPGDQIMLEGKLAYHKSGKAKDAPGKLVVTCFRVEVIKAEAPVGHTASTETPDARAPGPQASETKKGKPRYPKWHAPAERPN